MIVDGTKLASNIKNGLKEDVKRLKKITLAVVLVGDDKASKIYIRNKQRACEELNINSSVINLPQSTSQVELLKLIDELNKDDKVDAVLVQSPLPEQIDPNAVFLAISPKKDVDCFNPKNIGNMFIGNGYFKPCTPSGIIYMIKSCNYDLRSKNCVVVGRSNIVGKPTALLLIQNDATVTVANSHTKNLKDILIQADLIVSAVGKADFIKEDMVKRGAFVVDVGMNRDKDGKLCGDVDFKSVSQKAGFITPVPGGVGPMTIAMLMKNTVMAAKLNRGIR